MAGEWPVDAVGKPMAQISMGAEEKIGLPLYSNVVIGPASVTKFVRDNQEDIEEGLRECLKACEVIIAEERETILELVKTAAKAA